MTAQRPPSDWTDRVGAWWRGLAFVQQVGAVVLAAAIAGAAWYVIDDWRDDRASAEQADLVKRTVAALEQREQAAVLLIRGQAPSVLGRRATVENCELRVAVTAGLDAVRCGGDTYLVDVEQRLVQPADPATKRRWDSYP